MKPTSSPAALAILATTALSACGGDTIGPGTALPGIEGVWRATEAGVEETTLRLSADGTVHVVAADLRGRVCTSDTGAWTSDGGRLVLRLASEGDGAEPDLRSFDYAAAGGTLVLTTGGQSTTYLPATSVPSCLSYGFGSWQGTLSARIDDVPWAFRNISVDTGGIGAGRLEILACFDTAPTCETEEAVLRLKLSATGPLTPGAYPLGDASSGFYGLVNLFPDDPDFPGFDSLRLLPTGAFVLTSIAEERVVATFEFRANETAAPSPW
jgi:hypothetical protein